MLKNTHNMYRDIRTGAWNHEYLRICVVYRLLKKQRIGKARACELLADRKVDQPKRLVEMWCANPFKNLHIAA